MIMVSYLIDCGGGGKDEPNLTCWTCVISCFRVSSGVSSSEKATNTNGYNVSASNPNHWGSAFLYNTHTIPQRPQQEKKIPRSLLKKKEEDNKRLLIILFAIQFKLEVLHSSSIKEVHPRKWLLYVHPFAAIRQSGFPGHKGPLRSPIAYIYITKVRWRRKKKERDRGRPLRAW